MCEILIPYHSDERLTLEEFKKWALNEPIIKKFLGLIGQDKTESLPPPPPGDELGFNEIKYQV